jgi:tRNA(Ile)-lysidine synthase
MTKKALAHNPAKANQHADRPFGQLALRLFHHLRDSHWAFPGQRVGVAVSGGADSVALLLILFELKEKLGIVPSVVHFNHKLRGRASDADEKFVAKLAERLELPFFSDREDISGKSKRERINLEDAARRARYAFFERLAADRQLDKIAVAHTADDQAETVISHILRGTGLAGLGGIHPEFGCVFRPLLHFRRADLRAYLRSRRQDWRADATNRDTKRTRARIRLKLMPLLEKQFQPAVVDHLCRLAALARADDGWLNFSAKWRVAALAKDSGDGIRIGIRGLLGSPENQDKIASDDELLKEAGKYNLAVTSRMIRRIVEMVKPQAGQLNSVHVDVVLRLARQPDGGKSLPLPGGVEVRRERDFLVFRPATLKSSGRVSPGPSPFSHRLNLESDVTDVPLVEQSCSLRFRVIDWPLQGRETNVTGAVLDRERFAVPLVVRNWRPGDSMQPLGHQKRRKLSRLLNELGVNRWQKASWPVLACGEGIAWARGLPVAVEFAADKSTRKAVVITEVPISSTWQK